ncbi:ThuA domain-containing protein [Laceyella putida]|uniref:ThuA domain-containing protein n=1 Tax=Laceyella putida TaxID=110101 RepID=A0ABW2RLZ4_9BACL
MEKALILSGGWEGHQPVEVGEILAELLRKEGFAVEHATEQEVLADQEKVRQLDLIIPNWSMGTMKPEWMGHLLEAVRSGVGVAGLHGGMGDAFRNDREYQFMVGGQFVAHPGNDGVTYPVIIENRDHPIMQGIGDFTITSEQYYMHVDPAIQVLATTRFGDVVMPVVWTKKYGEGKVFYCSLGHDVDIVNLPVVRTIMARGMIWAAR